MPVIESLRSLFRREIVIEIDEMDAEKLGLAALLRAGPQAPVEIGILKVQHGFKELCALLGSVKPKLRLRRD